jgi:tetratricopeptide (TPR) repeat protein
MTKAPEARLATLRRALAARQAGRLDEAAAALRSLLAARPADFDALHLLGVVTAQRGDHRAAAEILARALAANPGAAEAHANLGQVRRALGETAAALASFERATRLDPKLADAHAGRGMMLRQLGRAAEALESFERALVQRPGHADALNGRGNALLDLKRPAEALASYDALLAARPGHADGWNNRGSALLDLLRPAEALAGFDKALALRPRYAYARNNRGMALRQLGREAEALADFEQALALEPDFAEARKNRGMVRLLLGDFAGGWPDFEWRFAATGAPRPRDYGEARWRGEGGIAGKTILLHAEQGFGDTIQFCRYAAPVAALGARVILAAPPTLKRLLASLAGAPLIAASDAETGPFDLHCPLLSVPLALKTTLATIPAAVPYLAPPAELARAWAERLAGIARPRIGLAWSGNPKHGNDGNRSIPLRLLAPLGAAKAGFVNLQKEIRDADRAALADFAWLAPPGAALGDFADAAALIAGLDLVISVDTAIAHLAGALGKPAWILLPYAPDWRWLRDGETSPWYPTARLFRQPAIGDWESVIAKLGAAL